MTPVNPDNSTPPVDSEPHWQELAEHSDEALLEYAIALEEDEEVDFPSPYRRLPARDGGKNWASPEKALSDPSIEDLLSSGAGHDWRVVFDAYGEIVTGDWEESWAICRTASFTSLLKNVDAAFCFARVAWHRCKVQGARLGAAAVWRQLEAMSPEARREVLAAFGQDGAISAAYEGIDIDPTTLSR